MKNTPSGAGVFVIQKDGSLSELRSSKFATEDDFQALLEKYPDLIPGGEIDPESPRRWILVTRELGIAMQEDGPDKVWLDHLFLDQEGVPTLIEVKRKSDTRARREVVAQMLDYAANAAAYLPVHKIREQFEARHPDPDAVLQQALGWNGVADEYWAAVKTNLEAGRLRLVFVADEIPPELRRIVEFLNRQTDPLEILAVEIPVFEGKGVRALVPRVLGQSQLARDHKAASMGAKIAWDWDSFSKKLATQGGAAVNAARQILEWAEKNAGGVVWMKNIEGSFIPRFESEEGDFFPIRITGFGNVGWNAPHQGNHSPKPFNKPELRRELLKRFQQIPGATVSLANLEAYKSLQLHLSALDRREKVRTFTDVLDWIRRQLSPGESGNAAK